ncbi:MAG TPA: response regulator transcription factor [Dehalococcoidia bacterium]|jgi:DNA-binding response OmpR family regulator|nr:response regulator transcription factor [Dehalococcoidia bacterium]
MQRVLLVYQTEGAALISRDLQALDLDVTSVRQDDAELALAEPGIDGLVVEAATNLEETRRLVESAGRPQRAPLLLLVRADQLAGIDPTWPIDDFAILPMAAEELKLRLRRAVYRKTGTESANVLRADVLALDLANYKVFVDDQPVSLTFKEFELLRFLMTNRGKVFTREALLNRVWGYEYFGGARTVDVHIRRLRAKIETGTTVYIETVRNVGYRFPTDR